MTCSAWRREMGSVAHTPHHPAFNVMSNQLNEDRPPSIA